MWLTCHKNKCYTSFRLRLGLSFLIPIVRGPSCLLYSSVLTSTVCDLLTTLSFTIIKTTVFLWGHFWYETSYCNLPQLVLFSILPHCQRTVTFLFWESNLIQEPVKLVHNDLWIMTPYSVQVSTNISEEHRDSIFWVIKEACSLKCS
jgi:hypothetical protein